MMNYVHLIYTAAINNRYDMVSHFLKCYSLVVYELSSLWSFGPLTVITIFIEGIRFMCILVSLELLTS